MPEQATIVQLAAAVATDLEAGEFVVPIEVKRTWIASQHAKRETITTTPKVLIVPGDMPGERVTKTQWEDKPSIFVGTFARVEAGSGGYDTACDNLMLLVEQLKDFYDAPDKTPGGFDVPLMEVNPTPLWDPDLLEKSNLFVSVLELTFHTWR